MDFAGQDIGEVIEGERTVMGDDCIWPTPEPGYEKVLVRGSWKLPEPVDAVGPAKEFALPLMVPEELAVESRLRRLSRGEVASLLLGDAVERGVIGSVGL